MITFMDYWFIITLMVDWTVPSEFDYWLVHNDQYYFDGYVVHYHF